MSVKYRWIISQLLAYTLLVCHSSHREWLQEEEEEEEKNRRELQ